MDTYTARKEHCPSLLAVSETISSQGAASLHAGSLSSDFRFAPVQEGGHTCSDIPIDRPAILFPLYTDAARVLPIGRVHLVDFV